LGILREREILIQKKVPEGEANSHPRVTALTESEVGD